MSDRDLHRTAREQYEEDVSFDRENIDAAADDFRAYGGDIWPEQIKALRQERKLPVLTINYMPQYVRQVVAEMRINPPAIKVRPADDGADKDMAETYTGLIRNIESQSRAGMVYRIAGEHATIGGIGHFRVVTRYNDDDGFDQDIAIEPILAWSSVVWDLAARKPTREDASHCFVTDLITRDEFKARWPDAAPNDWDAYRQDYPQWSEGDLVRVAEYWYRVPTTRTLWQLQDGSTVDASKLDAAQKEMMRPMVRRERKVETTKVRQCWLSGADMLEEPTDWAGKYIPIVPVIGEEFHTGQKIIRRGMVRGARDSQFMLTLHRTVMAEAIALSPKAKWQGTPRQFEGLEAYYDNAHLVTTSRLPYHADGQAPPPQRIPPEMASQALLVEVQQTIGDLSATTGIYPASLGKESNEKSGKAINARQREGDVSTYNFIDNMAISVEHAGRIIVDLLPRIYDNERVVRTLGDDGTEKMVRINVPMASPDGGTMRMFDLSRGKYDVVVDVGPSYTTKRVEAAESMMTMAQSAPVLMTVAPDLMVKAMDWPEADTISARLRKTVPPQLLEPIEGEPPPPPPEPSPEQMIAQAEMVKALAQAEKAKAELEIKRLELGLKAEQTANDTVRLGADIGKMRHDMGLDVANLLKPAPVPGQRGPAAN